MTPKTLIQLYPVIPAEGDERRRLRPIGRSRERYQKIIRDWATVARVADELGYWGLSTIEHHFHSEGYEVGPSPGVINAWQAALTKNIRLGALGYVMSTQNPVRVAEECAVLDHISEGRFFAGFARGYQARWSNVLGQHYNAKATLSDASAVDEQNRRVFEEQVDIVLKCWTEDSLSYDGEFFKIPYPSDTGVEGYPAYELARRCGTQGEVGPNNEIRRVSVVPKPYQQPHPPVFVATSQSKESAIYCARRGFIPCYFAPLAKAIEHAQAYHQAARAAGHDVKYGEKQCLVRWIHVNGSREEYERSIAKYDADIFKDFYSAFFPKAFDPEKIRQDPVRAVLESGLWAGGTPEDLRQQLQYELDRLPAEYLTLIFHWAQEPTAELLREMEAFMRDVLPKLDNSGSRLGRGAGHELPGVSS